MMINVFLAPFMLFNKDFMKVSSAGQVFPASHERSGEVREFL